MQYSKHKDAEPMNTVNRIRSIIDEIGLKTEISWIESGVHDIYSNHVSISNATFGTNGKGTSEEYTLASGYAELIERIQSGIIKTAIRYYRVEDQTGFIYSPDELIRTADELVAQDDAFTRFFFRYFFKTTTKEKSTFLKNFPKMEILPSEHFRCLPFADLATGQIKYIPIDILYPICGSNGMAAGNTPEEALVQALSELLERYANKAVLEGVVPPEIPREYWETSEIRKLVDEIESNDRYRVSIRDCSLGKGFPVTAVVISDCRNGKFGVHFGCHPSFEVAVERCLTEALQGKNLESASSMNEIGDDRMCSSVDNGPNLMKIGSGAYPIGFFSDEPSYAFVPGDDWRGLTNREMLKKLVGVIRKEGYDILIRDASHLGFPTYHAIIPGMSELFFSNGQRIKESRTVNRIISNMKHFPDLPVEEENSLLLYMKYKQYSIMENTFGWIANLPLKGEIYTTERVRAFLHYKRGEYFEAYNWFKGASDMAGSEEEKAFLLCASEYAWLMQVSADSEKAFRAIKCYFREDIAEKVHEVMRIPAQAMNKAFTPFPCFDCENCPHKDIDCDYPNNEKAFLKIQTALSKSKVDQHNTLAFLNDLYNS